MGSKSQSKQELDHAYLAHVFPNDVVDTHGHCPFLEGMYSWTETGNVSARSDSVHAPTIGMAPSFASCDGGHQGKIYHIIW